MPIAVVSDTHSRQRTVENVVRILAERRIELVIHCGDIEDADTVRQFRGFSTHYVLGNCDVDTPELRSAIKEAGGNLHEPFGDLEVEGIKLAWTHGDDHRLMRDIVESEHFDFVFYGHSHHAEQHRAGRALVVNPGALHRAKLKTFVLLDPGTKKLESVVVQ